MRWLRSLMLVGCLAGGGLALARGSERPPKFDLSKHFDHTQAQCMNHCVKPLKHCTRSCHGKTDCIQKCAMDSESCVQKCAPKPPHS